jgi:sensor histidine kinase regulating citrate/malate metabolism
VTDGKALLLQQDPQLPNCEEPANRLIVGILLSTEAEARNLGNNLTICRNTNMHNLEQQVRLFDLVDSECEQM